MGGEAGAPEPLEALGSAESAAVRGTGMTPDVRSWAVVPREFFRRPATLVAPDLLGCVLAHDTPAGPVAVEIVEVEAYAGEADPASHAFRGRTARNAVMFGEPGHAYVYFTYGMHFCVNLVCQPPGAAAAVLIRAGRVVLGADLARSRRTARAAGAAVGRDEFGAGQGGSGRDEVGAGQGGAGQGGAGQGGAGGARPGGSARAGLAERRIASGPGRLCQALGIDRAQNGADVCDLAGSLTVAAPPGFAGLRQDRITSGPRVGVRTGSEVAWRFWIAGDPDVSAYRPYVPRRHDRGR